MPDTFFPSTLLVKTNKLSVNVMADSLFLGTSAALVLKLHCFFSLEKLSFCLKHCRKSAESVFRYINSKNMTKFRGIRVFNLKYYCDFYHIVSTCIKQPDMEWWVSLVHCTQLWGLVGWQNWDCWSSISLTPASSEVWVCIPNFDLLLKRLQCALTTQYK